MMGLTQEVPAFALCACLIPMVLCRSYYWYRPEIRTSNARPTDYRFPNTQNEDFGPTGYQSSNSGRFDVALTQYRSSLDRILDNTCNFRRRSDVLRLLPGRFMSEADLLKMVPGPNIQAKVPHRPSYKPSRRVVVGSFISRGPFKTGNVSYINDNRCGCCVTDIGYEVVNEVTDFHGKNHTIINFNSKFQFIPSGRCANVDAPCGEGGQARCKQVTRAHWSLVWTDSVGAQLVAHEVPSHCECLNVGSV